MMAQETCLVMADELQVFMRDAFIRLGLLQAEAEVCAEVLITADLWGIESHGIARMKMYHDQIKAGQVNTDTRIEVVHQAGTAAVIDGHHSMGMVVGKRAMEMAIEEAKTAGLGAVAVRHSAHYGAAGYYAMMAVDQGMIGVAMTNSQPEVAPTFGVQPLLGTNPIAFGAPTDEDFPYLFDGATSVCAQGKFEVAARSNQPVPEGRAIDCSGNPMTDATQIVAALDEKTAAMLPIGGVGEGMGGHKGFGFGTIVEILCAALQGGSYMWGVRGKDEAGNPVPYRRGHFFMAIDIEHFIPLESFKLTTGDILRQLRASTRAPGQTRIYTAGEKEFEHVAVIRANGVPLDLVVQQELKTIQHELELMDYRFPF